jgi:ketosteroid isomerase-like protein
MTRAGILVVGLALACDVTSARADDVRSAVDDGNRAFVAAFLRGDAKAIGELYTEDAQVIAPGAPVARGRAAITAAWKKAMDSVKDVRLETGDVESSGDLASETGIVHLVGKDGAATKERYVVVWKRTKGGWKLHRDIWNGE